MMICCWFAAKSVYLAACGARGGWATLLSPTAERFAQDSLKY